jgi:hypothetical protein
METAPVAVACEDVRGIRPQPFACAQKGQKLPCPLSADNETKREPRKRQVSPEQRHDPFIRHYDRASI